MGFFERLYRRLAAPFIWVGVNVFSPIASFFQSIYSPMRGEQTDLDDDELSTELNTDNDLPIDEKEVPAAGIEEYLSITAQKIKAQKGTEKLFDGDKLVESRIFDPKNYTGGMSQNQLVKDGRGGFISIHLPKSPDTAERLARVNERIKARLDKIPHTEVHSDDPIRDFQFKMDDECVMNGKDWTLDSGDAQVKTFIMLELLREFADATQVPAVMNLGQIITATPTIAGHQLFEIMPSDKASPLGQAMGDVPHRVLPSAPYMAHSAISFMEDGSVKFEERMEHYSVIANTGESGLNRVSRDGNSMGVELETDPVMCMVHNSQPPSHDFVKPFVTVKHTYVIPAGARADLVGHTRSDFGAEHHMSIKAHEGLKVQIRDQYVSQASGVRDKFTELPSGEIKVDIRHDFPVPGEPPPALEPAKDGKPMARKPRLSLSGEPSDPAAASALSPVKNPEPETVVKRSTRYKPSTGPAKSS